MQNLLNTKEPSHAHSPSPSPSQLPPNQIPLDVLQRNSQGIAKSKSTESLNSQHAASKSLDSSAPAGAAGAAGTISAFPSAHSSFQPAANVKAQAQDCLCQQVIQSNDLKTCKACGGQFPAIAKLIQEKAWMSQELSNTRSKLDTLVTRERSSSSTGDVLKLQSKIRILDEELESKNDECQKMRDDMEILGQKLIDEIEKRAEIQHASENVNNELEELTQSLFEEANTLVAKEARERHGAQEKQQVLSVQLQEALNHLKVEQAQARELRLRISQLEQSVEDAALAQSRNLSKHQGKTSPQHQQPGAVGVSVALNDVDEALPRSVMLEGEEEVVRHSSGTHELLVPQHLAHFVDLKERCAKMKMTKIHDILYMRNALDDDVTPCLRFGGNPRTSTKKFIDAIIANTCFIDEMNDTQVKELEERDKRIAHASHQALMEKNKVETPTTSLFNKTVLERISHALSSPASSVEEKGGCSTCGKDEDYRYRFKISDVQADVWYPICLDCRSRLLTVVDFYQFIRNMRQGLFTSRSVEDLFLEALSLKRNMFYTRIGAGSLRNPDKAFQSIQPVRPNSSLLASGGMLAIDAATPTGLGSPPTKFGDL